MVIDAFNVGDEDVSTFLSDLCENPTPSIDEFLETHPDQRTRQIGRAVIAGLLGEDILKDRDSPPSDQNWIAHVVQAMQRGARTIEHFAKGNQVRFVTFNFDSIIEAELERLIRAIYKPSADRLKEALQAFPVTHVHGQLPPGRSLKRSWLQQAENKVRVVHDEVDEEVTATATGAVASARILCFLGFSYHFENLKRFNMRGRLNDFNSNPFEAYGSCFGLRKEEPDRVEAYFGGRIRLASPDKGACATLHDFYILRAPPELEVPRRFASFRRSHSGVAHRAA